jgi:hypothetical protein
MNNDFTPKEIVFAHSLMMRNGPVWDDAGSFVEWAGMGGVSNWDNGVQVPFYSS